MQKIWQLQEAKSKFSEVVEEALTIGPQVISKHGVESVIIISIKDYQKLKKPKNDLITFFKLSPKIDLNYVREKYLDRKIDL
jgi:antitoxin Phd